MSENVKTPPMKVGLIGCGDIARKAYLPFAKEQQEAFEIVAVCDVREDVARALAEDFGIAKVYPTPAALLADPEIEIVMNLTHPAGHAPLNRAALEAGKHVYCEKPFALNLAEGQAVLEAAQERGLKVCCAPDTVLGSGTQTTRQLVDRGAIGKVLSAKIECAGPGHEHWHPNPEFYYKQGGGPMLDMGPYYISALIHILGPIKSVVGRVTRGYAERPIRCGELEGKIMKVEAPTHYVGALETVGGTIVQVLFSFDHNFGKNAGAPIDLCGTEGCIRATDPNCFDGEPELNRTYAGDDFVPQAMAFAQAQGRGLGVVDLVGAIRENRDARCSGAIAFHALEVMLAFEASEKTGGVVLIHSSCEQPEPMPQGGV